MPVLGFVTTLLATALLQGLFVRARSVSDGWDGDNPSLTLRAWTELPATSADRASMPHTVADILHEAEAAFHEGSQLRDQPEEARKQFRLAAERYEQLRTRGVTNPALCCNQGNAWFLAGDLPRAILSYRRGLRLAPHDAELRMCLEHAREQVVYPSHATLGRPAVEHWPPWLPRPSARTCFYGAVLSYVLGWAACARWLTSRRRGWLALTGGAFAVALLLALLVLLGESRARKEERFPPVVVAEDGVLLRKGNGLGYPLRSETPLNRGVEARLLHAKADWLQIELASGEVGWVPKSYMLVEKPAQ